MKAISIRQPWAGLVVCGIKNVENRNWKTEYRGPLAIHSSAASGSVFEWCEAGSLLSRCNADGEAVKTYFQVAGEPTQRGAILGTVNLEAVWQNPECSPWASTEFRYHWVLTDPVQFDQPIPIKGRLGLWDWNEGD